MRIGTLMRSEAPNGKFLCLLQQGPWKLLLLVADTFSNAFTELLDTYQQLGDTLLLLLQARELFSYDANMAKILSSMYKDVLEFHLQAFKYFQQPSKT